jgi:glycosyltransferase 2 family protein
LRVATTLQSKGTTPMTGDASAQTAGVADVELTDTLTRSRSSSRPASFVPRMPSQAFAVPPRAKRVRRPTDAVMLLSTLALLLWSAMLVDTAGSGFHGALADLIETAPNLLDPLWQVLQDLLVVWTLLVLGLALVRRHLELVRDLVIATVAVVIAAAVTGRLAAGEWPDLWAGAVQRETPVDFPPLVLAMATAVISVASPHLTRPYRYAGRWLVLLGALSAAMLGLSDPGGTGGAVALGWAVAAGVHLVAGSPGGLPSMRRIRAGLLGLGVDAEVLGIASQQGVVWAHARDEHGREFDVKVYGRDAWDGQLLVSVWRFLWYRDGGPTLSLTRLQQVEHEAFLTLLADARGVPVVSTLAAGLDAGGDALLVTERVGRGLDEIGPGATDAQLAAAWTTVAQLHSAGISHGGIRPGCVRVVDDEARLSDFARAEVSPTRDAQLIDQAQLLVATAMAVGPERAVSVAADVVGLDELAAVSSFVQPAALTVPLRTAADAAGVDIDHLRATVIARTQQDPPELQRLRRLSIGRVLLLLMVVVATSALISSIADIGLDTIIDSMREASGPLLLLAFVIGFTPRVANAVGLSAVAPSKIPLGRLTALQLAITFVNLAMPSTAARAAVNIRFFQRSGVPADSAVSLGVLDSVMGFVGQITLIVSILVFGLGSLDLDIAVNFSDDTLTRLLVLIAVALVAGVSVVLAVPKFRAAVGAALRKVWALVGPVLSSPARLVQSLGANIAAELLFSWCMYTVLRAFGQDVNYADVVLVNEFVALFAGLMPVPGGVGVTEAALTAGFVAIGVDESTALAAAITYRVLTYYTPPIIGFGAFRWLQRQQFL